MDKGLTKKIFLMDQVPTPKGVSMLKEKLVQETSMILVWNFLLL